MNNLDDKIKFISSIRLLLDDYMKNYTPQVIRNLSKDMFDLYITKKETIDELLSLLDDPNFEREEFGNITKEKLNVTKETITSTLETSDKTKEEAKIEIYKKIIRNLIEEV